MYNTLCSTNMYWCPNVALQNLYLNLYCQLNQIIQKNPQNNNKTEYCVYIITYKQIPARCNYHGRQGIQICMLPHMRCYDICYNMMLKYIKLDTPLYSDIPLFQLNCQIYNYIRFWDLCKIFTYAWVTHSALCNAYAKFYQTCLTQRM